MGVISSQTSFTGDLSFVHYSECPYGGVSTRRELTVIQEVLTILAGT